MTAWREVRNGHELQIGKFVLGVYVSAANWILCVDGMYVSTLSNEKSVDDAKAHCIKVAKDFFADILLALDKLERN